MQHFREEVKSRIPAVHLETERLRSVILEMSDMVPSSGPAICSPDGKHVLHWKHGPFMKLRPDSSTETAIEHRTIRCAVFDAAKQTLAVADFNEYKLKEELSDHDLFWMFDDCSSEHGNLARAFLSGWESYLLLDQGNFAHLDHIAARRGVGTDAWCPLVSRFIDEIVFKSSFVVLGDPYPHDVVSVLNRLIDDMDESDTDPDDQYRAEEAAMNAFAYRRHQAKWKFFSNHLGLTRYSEQAETPRWMYKVARGKDPILSPSFRKESEFR